MTLIPTSTSAKFPLEQLELWAQVAVRGEIGEDGAFEKWKDETWELKRQELAAMPVPFADFPFPGNVAKDKLHWLRQEYEHADDADKSIMVRQLLDRAEAAGDEVEAVRWQFVLSAAEVRSPKGDPQ